jgi:hypothetical protein
LFNGTLNVIFKSREIAEQCHLVESSFVRVLSSSNQAKGARDEMARNKEVKA